MDGVVLIILTGFAILGVYYVVELFIMPTDPCKGRAVVVLPCVQDDSVMSDALFYAMEAYPCGQVVICGEEGQPQCTAVPAAFGRRVEYCSPEQLPDYFRRAYRLQNRRDFL